MTQKYTENSISLLGSPFEVPFSEWLHSSAKDWGPRANGRYSGCCLRFLDLCQHGVNPRQVAPPGGC